MSKREAVLLRHSEKLKKYPNYLSARADQNKIINKKETDIEAITVYVDKKLFRQLLSPSDIIPREIEGIPTDVVELSSEDFKLGRTSKGDLPPHLQRRLTGVIKDE